MKEQLITALLDQVLKIITETRIKIHHQLRQKCESIAVDSPKDVRVYVTDFLDNELIQNIAYLLLKMTKFDIFSALGKPELNSKFIRELFVILEYDKSNPTISYALSALRGKLVYN